MLCLSMSELSTFRWSFDEDVAQYQKAGIKSIGVWREKLTDYGEEKGAELLAEAGLKVSNLFWAGGFTGSNGCSYRDCIEDTEEAISQAALLNAGCLIVYTGTRNGHTYSHARRLVRNALEELVPLASVLGVTLAIEPMHPGCAEGWTFLTELRETMDLIEYFDSPYLQLAFDTYQLGHDREILEAIPRVADKTAIVHLGDSRQSPTVEQNRCPLGEGNLPLEEIITSLTRAGYEGDFDVELLGEDMEQCCYQSMLHNSARYLGNVLNKPLRFQQRTHSGMSSKQTSSSTPRT